MPLTYTGTTIGKIVIKQDDRKYTIQIRTGNCLAVFIHSREATPEEMKKHKEAKYVHTLYSFFVDEQHIENIMKDNGGKAFYDDVVSVELNMFHNTNYKLVKYFTMSGYPVKCYYKEEKD